MWMRPQGELGSKTWKRHPFRKEWSWPGFTFSALQKPNWMTRWLVIFPMAVYDAVRSWKVLIANVCERKQQTHDPNGNDRQNERNTNIPNRPYNVAKKSLACVRSVDLICFFCVFFDCAIPARSLAWLWNSRDQWGASGQAQLEGKGGLAILITSNDFQSFPCIFLLWIYVPLQWVQWFPMFLQLHVACVLYESVFPKAWIQFASAFHSWRLLYIIHSGKLT